MLTLTEEATTAVKTITAQFPDAPQGGVRIAGAGSPESQFALSVVDAPEPADTVVENSGATGRPVASCNWFTQNM